MVDYRRICSACGRARKDHQVNFGKNCKLTPLSEDERERVIKEVEERQRQIDQGDIDDDHIQELDQRIKELLAKQADLEAQALKNQETIKKQQLLLKHKEKAEQLRKLEERVERLSIGIEGDQAKMIELQDKVDDEPPSTDPLPAKEDLETRCPAMRQHPRQSPVQ